MNRFALSTIRTTASLAVLLLLAACGGGTPPQRATAASASAPQEAVSRVDDVTVRASALPTATLAPEVASQYGIARDDNTVMLLVGVRQGPEAQEIALPAQVSAKVTNLSGQRQDIALRELRSGELLDYVGTVKVSLPDTLRFDVTVVREGGATATMQFSREFYPQ